ncbi:MAG: DUF58 domain-containing protein [Gemmatimonadaceae bacterium]|nr:DUF58 domain-containing protein [Gemmatimonadaceae bacterium]
MIRRLLSLVTSYTPTSRLAFWVALAALAWLIPLPSPWSLVTGTIAIAAVLGVALWDALQLPAADAIDVSRTAPEQLGSGDDDVVTYTIASSWPRDLNVVLAERVPVALGGGAVRTHAAQLGAMQSTRITAPLRGVRRGPSALGPVALRVHGPLGLIDVIRDITFEDQTDVVPSLSQVRKFRLLAVQRRLRDAGVRQVRRRGGGMTFDALREYVPGDDPRHIDWKASGRRGVAQVRQYTVEQGQTVILALDAGRLMTQMAGDRSRFEYAINSCLVLADVALQGRDKIGLLVFDDQLRGWVPPSTGTAAMRAIRSTLASCDARLVEPDYALAFRSLAQRQRSRALVICLSDVIDVRASRAVVTQTRHAALRHITVFLALRNDALVAAAQPAAQSAETDVWRGAAAESLLDARADALQRMRRAGVQVLDVPPQAMSAALVNRYLSIKARGEL